MGRLRTKSKGLSIREHRCKKRSSVGQEVIYKGWLVSGTGHDGSRIRKHYAFYDPQPAIDHPDNLPTFSTKTPNGETWICNREEDLRFANLRTVAYIRYRADGSMEYVKRPTIDAQD